MAIGDILTNVMEDTISFILVFQSAEPRNLKEFILPASRFS